MATGSAKRHIARMNSCCLGSRLVRLACLTMACGMEAAQSSHGSQDEMRSPQEGEREKLRQLVVKSTTEEGEGEGEEEDEEEGGRRA